MFSCFFHQNIAFQSHIYHSPITFPSPKRNYETIKTKVTFCQEESNYDSIMTKEQSPDFHDFLPINRTFCPINKMVVGCRFLVVGCRLLVVGFWLSVGLPDCLKDSAERSEIKEDKTRSVVDCKRLVTRQFILYNQKPTPHNRQPYIYILSTQKGKDGERISSISRI